MIQRLCTRLPQGISLVWAYFQFFDFITNFMIITLVRVYIFFNNLEPSQSQSFTKRFDSSTACLIYRYYFIRKRSVQKFLWESRSYTRP